MGDAAPAFDPFKLAAVLYRPEDDVDTLIEGFAADLRRGGGRIGGIVQRNIKDERGRTIDMQAVDLLTGQAISISHPPASRSGPCKLDPAGLSAAAQAVTRAIDARVGLVIVNRFSTQEAQGGGLRAELGQAIAAGLPTLTTVPGKCLAAWTDFTGDCGTMLLCSRWAIEDWWADLAARRPESSRSGAAEGSV